MIGKAHRTLGNQHHVFASGHHQARQLHRVGDIVDRGDGAGRQVSSVHDGRIHFDLAIFVQHRAAAGIEYRVVLEQAGASLNGLQGGATQFHDAAAMLKGGANTFQVSKCGFVVLDVIECAGSSVHHQGIGTFLAHWICWVISVTRAFSHIRIQIACFKDDAPAH